MLNKNLTESIQYSFINTLFKQKNTELEIIYSKRLKKSWRVIAKNGKRILTIPDYLRSAPTEISEALEIWAMLPHFKREKKNGDYLIRKRNLEEKIRTYITNSNQNQQFSTANPSKYQNQTKGLKYDLKEIFDSVNSRYFNSSLNSFLRWGNQNSRTSYFTERKDSEGKKFNLITVAGIYDSEIIPRFVLEGLMYHEMLHIAIPSYFNKGRRVIHGKEFKKAEKKYQYYEQWVEWEKQNMPALLRYKRGKRPKQPKGLRRKRY